MRIVLCGDLVPTQASAPAMDRGDCGALMNDILPLLRSADYTVANLECALTDRTQGIRKCGPCLKGKPEYARVIADCGFTHLGLSNNHMMDFGVEGTRERVRQLCAEAHAALERFGGRAAFFANLVDEMVDRTI